MPIRKSGVLVFYELIAESVTTMVNNQVMKKIFVLVVFGALISSCSVIEKAIVKPTVRVEKVSYQPVNLKQGRLDSKIRITNPNAFALPLRTMISRLKLNGHQIANIKLNFDKNLPANESMVISAPISFQYGELVNGIRSLLEQHAVKYQLEGEIDLQLISVPFSKAGEFRLKLR